MTLPPDFPTRMPSFSEEAPSPPKEARPRTHALTAVALGWASRGMWAVCVGVYLTVFVGGIHSGADELMTLGRALGFTLVAALLGRLGLRLIGNATVPAEVVQMDNQAGRVGPHLGRAVEANVAEQADEGQAA